MIAHVNILSAAAASEEPGKKSFTHPEGTFRASRASKEDLWILLVEDDYFAAMTLENALTDAGYRVAGVVDNAEEAISILGVDGPDLVICDIRLVGTQDGLHVAKEAMKLSIPFIVASAHTDAETKARGEVLSPAGWLVKPFGVTDFLAAVDAAFSKNAAH